MCGCFHSHCQFIAPRFFPELLSVCPCWGPKVKWGSQKSRQHDHLGNLKKLTLSVRALAFATKNLTNALQLGMHHRLHLSGEPDRPSDLAHGRCTHAMLGGCSRSHSLGGVQLLYPEILQETSNSFPLGSSTELDRRGKVSEIGQ